MQRNKRESPQAALHAKVLHLLCDVIGYKICYDDKIKDVRWGDDVTRMGGMKNTHTIFTQKHGRHHLVDQSIDTRIILKWIEKNSSILTHCVRMWSGFIWLKM